MTKAQKTKWIEALRSGKYTQGFNQLKNIDSDGAVCYCCLGVANEVLELNSFSANFIVSAPVNGLHDATFLSHYTQAKLMELNDDMKLSFEQIADYIEANIGGI